MQTALVEPAADAANESDFRMAAAAFRAAQVAAAAHLHDRNAPPPLGKAAGAAVVAVDLHAQAASSAPNRLCPWIAFAETIIAAIQFDAQPWLIPYQRTASTPSSIGLAMALICSGGMGV